MRKLFHLNSIDIAKHSFIRFVDGEGKSSPVKFLFALIIFSVSAKSIAQVPNLIQTAVIETGNGITPNLVGAGDLDISGNYAYVIGKGDMLEILDITLPGLPVHKGSLASGTGGASILRPTAIVVAGNFAYISSYGGQALEIVDISDPSNPKHKGILRNLAGPRGIYISGNYAYVATYGALDVVDISDPSNPKLAGTILDGNGSAPYLYSAAAVCVSGNYAYVGSLGNGSISPPALEVIDISTPTKPVHASSLVNGNGSAPYLSYPYKIRIQGNLLYTADQWNNAFEIIDISNPLVPTHKGSMLNGVNGSNLFRAFDIAIQGNTAFIANYQDYIGANLEIVDITDPTAPAHKGSLQNVGLGLSRGIKLVNNYAVMTSEQFSAIEIIDITSLSSPVVKSIVSSGSGGPILSNPTSVSVYNNRAYVVGQNSVIGGSLEVLDVSNPTVPVHKGSYSTSANFVSVAVAPSSSGVYAYAVEKTNSKLYVFNVTNPSFPVLATTVTSGSGGTLFTTPSSVFVSNNYLYITGSASNSLEILDISNPVSPAHQGTFIDGVNLKGAQSVYVTTNGNAIIASSTANTLAIVDIKNPASLSLEGTLSDGVNSAHLNNPVSVYVDKNNIAYVASNGTSTSGTSALEIVDVSNPFAPAHLGSITDLQTNISRPTGVYVSGNYAFVSMQYGIEAIDITNPAKPLHQAHLSDNQGGAFLNSPNSIFISGGYAFLPVVGLSAGLDIVYLYAPKINVSLTPGSGPIGTSVTLTGQNFNTFFTASINGVPCPITAVTATSLTLTIPNGASIGKIALNYNGQSFTSSSNFIVTPTATASSSIGQTNFTANWSNVGAVTYYLDVSTDNFTTYVSGYNNLNVGNVLSVVVAGLAQGTNYQYRVKSSNGASSSTYSNTIITNTLPVTPNANAATQVSQSGFIANWSASPGATGYYIDVAYDNAFSNFVVGYSNLVIPNPATTSQVVTGLNPYTNYYYRVRSSANSGVSISSNVINVVTLDIIPPVITPASTPNPSTITLGNTPVLNVIITDNVRVDSSKLFYRGISQKYFKNVTMQGTGGAGGNYTVTAQTNWYDSLGLEYYFKATDEAGNSTVTQSYYIQLISPSISLPALPSGTGQGDYKIITFPYQLATDNKVTTVYSGVPWNDNTKAAMWWWNPSSQNGRGSYDQYGTSNTFQTVDPGKGYWAITSTSVTPQLANVPAPKYNRDNLYSMTLKPNWNEIGNPYPVAISWDDVIAFNKKNSITSFSSLSVYDGKGFITATGGVLLKPFEGGFVKNLSSSDITIQIPFPGEKTIGGRMSNIDSDISQEAWKVFLFINQDELANRLGGFGMHSLAKLGPDSFDNFNPPRLKDSPELNFKNIDFPTTLFSCDMVPSQENYRWQFTPDGKYNSLAQLTWNQDLKNNSSKQLFLLDEQNINVVDMTQISSYDFILNKESRFSIFYGSNIEQKVVLANVAVSAPYPNPLGSNAEATMNLNLPDTESTYQVALQIYNRQGELIEQMNTNLPAGIHPLKLSLDNNSLASGIYFYKVSIESKQSTETFTGKIVKP